VVILLNIILKLNIEKQLNIFFHRTASQKPKADYCYAKLKQRVLYQGALQTKIN
jgi:hypothetical protein